MNCDFIDGDDLHPKENVDKMSRGEPLNDDDRYPWLKCIHDKAQNVCDQSDKSRPLVLIACSALKKSYRDNLRGQSDNDRDIKTYFLYLKGSEEVLHNRMAARKGHFMTDKMLKSQLSTLEEPNLNDEVDVCVVDIDSEPDEVLNKSFTSIKSLLKLDVCSSNE